MPKDLFADLPEYKSAPPSPAPRDLFANTETSAQPETPQQERSLMGETARPFLRAAKSTLAGTLGGSADFAQQAVEFPIYLGHKAAQGAKELITGKPQTDYKPIFGEFGGATKGLEKGFDAMTGGLTAPRNKGEEILETAQQVAGAFIAPQAAVNAAAPLAKAGKEVVKKVLGVADDKIQKFVDAGITPTLANISKFRPISQIQNFLSGAPGAASRIERVLQHQIDNVAKKVYEGVDNMGGTIEEAGDIIGEGARAYKKTLKAKSSKIYEDVFSKVPDTTPIRLNSFKNLIDNDPELQEAYISGGEIVKRKLDRISNVLSTTSITPKGKLVNEGARIEGTVDNNPTLRRIKAIRSSIGKDTNNMNIPASDRAELKKIYGALSNDLKEGVLDHARKEYGDQEAWKIYSKYNLADQLFKSRTEFIEKTITPLEKAKTPEKIYSLATSGVKRGGAQINNVFKVLNPAQKEFIQGSIVNKMGLAPKNLQDETEKVFSLKKFREDWMNSNFSPEAKKAIFKPEQIKAYDNISKAIVEIERTGRFGQQNANRAKTLGWGALVYGSLFTPYISVPQAATAVGGARIGAQMMTSPKFVNWLAAQPKVKTPSQIEDSIKRLGAIAASANPNLQEDLLDFLGAIAGVSDAKAEEYDETGMTVKDEQEILRRRRELKGRIPSSYTPEELEAIDPITKNRLYR